MHAHALLPAVNRLLQMVEETSGLPVAVAQQSDLSTLATLRPATPQYQAHVIAYRDADEASSYHVAFEAALLLRIVQVPPEQRVNLTEKREAREKVISQVEKLVKGSLSLALARKAGLGFYDGLMVQLRSTGPGLWADRWLFEQVPELRGLQAAVLQSQVQGNVPAQCRGGQDGSRRCGEGQSGNERRLCLPGRRAGRHPAAGNPVPGGRV